MFLAANSLALCYYLGPSRSASLPLKCALVCAGAKFVEIVITSSPSKVRLCAFACLCMPPAALLTTHVTGCFPHAQYEKDGKELSSIWDYDPPGDVASTGAWVVLRELATTLSRCCLHGRPRGLDEPSTCMHAFKPHSCRVPYHAQRE